MAVQIFAVGGGGFTHPEDCRAGDSVLEDYLLGLAATPGKTRIGYIGHASDDDTGKIDAFYARFRNCNSSCHLPVTADAAEVAGFVSRVDIIYVGGGNTRKMLSHWQQTGIADAIIRAAHDGVILSGVSAGAICWFSELLLLDSEGEFRFSSGLGLLGGSACPHYSNDPARKAAFDGYIEAGNLKAGLGIDDGVGVYIVDGVVAGIERARKDEANAYHVSMTDRGLVSEPLSSGYKMK